MLLRDHVCKGRKKSLLVPRAQNDGRSTRTPAHHKSGEVGHLDLGRHVLDTRKDDEPAEGEQEAKHDKREPDAQKVRAEGKNQEHDGAGDVRGDSIQICLDGGVLEGADDLRQEERDGLQWYTEADLDGEEGVGGRIFEDLDRLSELELLGHDRRRVDLHTVQGEVLLLSVEELSFGSRLGQVQEGEHAEQHTGAAFDDEQVAPALEAVRLDLEDAEGKKASEGVGDVGRGVEEGEAARKLATAVEGGEVVDDQREEGALSHAEEPAQRKDAAEVLRRGHQERHRAEAEHQDREHEAGAELLAKHGDGWCEQDVGYEEDGDDHVVLVGLEAQVV